MRFRAKDIFAKTLLFALVTSVVAAGSIKAQAPLPPPEEIERARKEMKVALDEYARQAADEYLEAIEQLQDILNDYSSYFSRIDDATLRAYQISFDQFATGIDRGTYSENPKYLSEDLTKFIGNLKDQESRLKDEKSAKDRKLLVLVQSLRKDLTVVNNLIEIDIEKKLAKHHKLQDQIERYVQLALAKDQIRILTIQQERLADSAFEGGETKIFYPNKDGKGQTWKVAPPPKPVPVTTPDGYVQVPDVPGVREIGLVRKYTDTLSILSSITPIYVTQSVGVIEVSGWNDDIMSAELEIEVSAETHELEKMFIAATTLRIASEKNGYYVETVFPKLTDPRTKILHSTLRVNVPSENPIVCDNSFGEISARDLESGLMVKGRYSKIKVGNIEGKVRVENSMGPIDLKDVYGSVSVLNSDAEVTLKSCEGDISVQNENASITLSRCDGNARLVNSGPITVVDHSGDVSVENSNGQVNVHNLDGNLTAFNSYRPMMISYVDGSVSVENTNSTIQANEISGALDANNRYGSILAKAVEGPLTVTSENGKVTVILDGELRGSSTISSLSGMIDISIPPDADLLVRAETEDGKIQSTLPISLKTSNRLTSGEIKLGDGNSRLFLKGKKSAININVTH